MITAEQKRKYFKLKRRNVVYTALEGIDGAEWFWSIPELEEFDWMWNKDKPLKEIARELQRSEVAILLLSLDRIAKKKIKPREGWRIW